jgi:hypothetical protein
VEYNHTATPWPLKHRDFVLHGRWRVEVPSGKLFLEIQSDQDPACPPFPDKVRGEVRAAYVLTRLGPAKTRVELEVFADPKGWVPHWIVNWFQSNWPRRTLEGIRRQAAKPDVGENAGVRDALEGS